MIPETVITVDNVTKDFILQEDETILAKIVGKANGSSMPRKIRALDDISFTLKKGEVLGIIGRNGSGKTTLLRVLAGIYTPTRGHVHVRGKLMPLINSSVGVQPKLTMRDNIYLVGSLFGISRSEISSKFDSIVEFSELDDFVDVQLYKFSSGMGARLFFSIAVHLEPEVLLLDEVFATGDVRFKEKSRDKMMELVQGDATVIMTSHSEDFIKEVADRIIWIERGRVQMDGVPEEVIMAYKKDMKNLRIGGLTKKKEIISSTKIHLRNRVLHRRKPLTIFLHIPKSGGTTIRSHTVKNLQQGEVLAAYNTLLNGKDPNVHIASLSEEECHNIKVIFGHLIMFNEARNSFAGREIRLITFLRDPANRIFSLYDQYRKEYDITGCTNKKSLILSENGDILQFEEWFDKSRSKLRIMNPVAFALYWSSAVDNKITHINKAHFKLAKKALQEFTFVGITEQPEDFSICYNLLGVNTSHVDRENVATRSYIDLAKSRFKNMNELKDYVNSSMPYAQEFYEYAKELNKKQKKQLKSKLAKSLAFA